MAGLRLKAELGGDGSGFDRMMNKAGMTAKNFGTGVISPLKNLIAGAFTVGAITQLTRSTIDWASKLRDTADMLGVNVEWLQKMQNGAQLVGADIEDVAKFINEMNRARQEALKNPKGREAQAFGRLGASPGDIENLSTQAFFEKIVGAFKNGANTQLVNDVQEVGGRSARNLIAAFSSQFASDTPILSEQLIDQLDDIGDNFTALGQQLKVGLAPAIASVAEALVKAVNQIRQSIAFLGGAMAQFTAKDYAKMVLTGGILNPKNREKLKDMFALGELTMADEKKSQDATAAGAEKAKGASRDARRNREQGPPQFDPLAITPKAGKSSPDALVKVGNFLGSAPGAVNAIAQKQLEATKQQLVTQQQANEILKQISMRLAVNRGLGLGIPAL